MQPASTQYATDENLAARQRLWSTSVREPAFDLIPWVLDQAGLGPGASADVLDLGCGNGPYERELAARAIDGRHVALDLSAGMLQTLDVAGRIQGDAQGLPRPDDSFDVVLAPHMLYHVPDIAAAGREARRVLRPGGVFVAVTNGDGNLGGLAEIVERAVGTTWRMRTPATTDFSLENGADPLRAAFGEVMRVDCPPSELIVTDVDVFAGYVASTADHYEAEVGMPWATVVERCRALAVASADEHGRLRLRTSVGCFVCR